MLFPPQGLSAADFFFAEERAGIFGRTYVGVLATALPSHVTAQVRTLATLLQAPALTVGDDEAIDGYWTLVVYFNSLRELGRASNTRPGGHPRVSKFGLGQDRADGGLVARAREAEPPLHQVIFAS